MGERYSQDVRVGEGLSQSQHATQPPGLAQMARIIADLTQVIREAAKVRREEKELAEVEVKRLQRRKDREITVTILDQMERERTASRAQEQILEQVRAQEPKGAT